MIVSLDAPWRAHFVVHAVVYASAMFTNKTTYSFDNKPLFCPRIIWAYDDTFVTGGSKAAASPRKSAAFVACAGQRMTVNANEVVYGTVH
jgi:hypothetical protein